MIDDLKGLSGGLKQKWIREHVQLIKDYCEVFGRDATCEQFNLENQTLDSIYARDHQEVPFTKADRAMIMAQMSRQAANDLRGEVQELKRDFGKFQTNVAGQVANIRRHLTDDQRAVIAAMWTQENKKEPVAGPGRGHTKELPDDNKTSASRSADVFKDTNPTRQEATQPLSLRDLKMPGGDKDDFERK